MPNEGELGFVSLSLDVHRYGFAGLEVSEQDLLGQLVLDLA
ncbi:MAG: hypothetical protein ACLGHS_11590 [Actinomycetes bacterium]